MTIAVKITLHCCIWTPSPTCQETTTSLVSVQPVVRIASSQAAAGNPIPRAVARLRRALRSPPLHAPLQRRWQRQSRNVRLADARAAASMPEQRPQATRENQGNVDIPTRLPQNGLAKHVSATFPGTASLTRSVPSVSGLSRGPRLRQDSREQAPIREIQESKLLAIQPRLCA